MNYLKLYTPSPVHPTNTHSYLLSHSHIVHSSFSQKHHVHSIEIKPPSKVIRFRLISRSRFSVFVALSVVRIGECFHFNKVFGRCLFWFEKDGEGDGGGGWKWNIRTHPSKLIHCENTFCVKYLSTPYNKISTLCSHLTQTTSSLCERYLFVCVCL